MTASRWFPVAFLLVTAGAGVGTASELETRPAEHRVVDDERVFDGVIEAVQQSTVSAQTSGRVVELPFDVDDPVQRGDVIVRFRDVEQRARLEQAEAALREARARLAEARTEHQRMVDLHGRKLVAKAALDRARADLDSARARVEGARARRDEAAEALENTVVRAPYSGIVVARHVEVGETAQVGRALLTGLSLESLRAVASVPQRHIQAVRAAGRARVLVDGRDGPALTSEALTVFPFADPVTHTFRVRAALPEAPAGLFPGMRVKVRVRLGERRALLIPAAAVIRRSELTGVYVVDAAGLPALRQLRLGEPFADGMIEVLAGLEPGERVAVDPIRAGARLKQRRTETAP